MTSTPRQRSTAQLALILGALTAFGPLSIDMYLPGLPAIAADLGADAAAIQLTLSAFFIGMAAGQTLYGPLSDRIGRRAPLIVGCVFYTLATIACALAPTAESLVVLRFAQALGGCAGMVIARSVVRDLFDARESARMYSILMLVMGLAPITAPLIGGQLLTIFDWRAIFWILAVYGAMCVVLVAWLLPETLPAEHRSRAGVREVAGVYGRLLLDRHFLGYALAGGLAFAGMFAYISGSPFVLIELYGVSPQHYGWIFGLNALGLISASQVNRRLLLQYRSEVILSVALLLVAGAALVLVAAAASGFGGLIGLLIPLFVCISSVGLVGPNTAAVAMAPHGRAAGSASALLGTLQFVVGAIAGVLVGVTHNGTALPMAAVIAGCSIAALIAFQGLALRAAPAVLQEA
ncbi:MAG TPA: Bcr/CflA family multidrug efflux MFS transporter [Roseiflexaceae bacterium]|nr:Bcr/CflA family multidrug efflux MFS transporter [Roseiflexaceae bacterium]HMP42698.1 Bcr/CflA family multidrug efflux MFS transporter [Roseiflexaceae bacterium]